jgi:hypothetical protein
MDERHKRTAVSAPRCVQLDYMVAVINTALKRWRISQILFRQMYPIIGMPERACLVFI